MIYSFAASTCTLVVVAYLLKRGPILAYLAGERLTLRAAAHLGFFFGLVGIIELYFAKDRAPYDTYTLIITFAALRCGGIVGLMTAALMVLGTPLLLPQETVGRVIVSIAFCLLVGLGARRIAGLSQRKPKVSGRVVITAGIAALFLAETNAVLLRFWMGGDAAAPFSLPIAVLRTAANAAGLILLHMILSDALVRRAAEQFRLEAEQGRTLLAEAELAALRARVHPHFLFNALTSIAALCRIAPDRAEAATVQLGHIMRRALESPAQTVQTLDEEIDYVKDYVKIEELRLGNRLTFTWDIAPNAKQARVPPFVLQTLVENSILHGIAPKLGPGYVRVVARRRKSGQVFIAVADSGVGMNPAHQQQALSAAAPDAPRRQGHGLILSSEQLCLVYGRGARVRLFSKPDVGTMVAFRLPASAVAVPDKKNE